MHCTVSHQKFSHKLNYALFFFLFIHFLFLFLGVDWTRKFDKMMKIDELKKLRQNFQETVISTTTAATTTTTQIPISSSATSITTQL